MSSFSARLDTATDFADHADESYKAVIAARVPAERIISTANTGFGCLGESEYVVLGEADEEYLAVTWRECERAVTSGDALHELAAASIKPSPPIGRRVQ